MNGLTTAQRFVTITGTMHKPALEKVRALVAAASAAVPNNALLIQNVNVALALDDCTAAQTISEKAAMDDPRARAVRLALDSNVDLGPVSAMSEFNLPSSAVRPSKPDRFFAPHAGNDILQATAALDVVLVTNLSVTFGLR